MEEFKKSFIKYIDENSTNAFTNLKLEDWKWIGYYNMYKCGNSFKGIFDM